MEVKYERCCGIDVHKKTVVACVILPGPEGQPSKEIRTFETMTGDLEALSRWLKEQGDLGAGRLAQRRVARRQRRRYTAGLGCRGGANNLHHPRNLPITTARPAAQALPFPTALAIMTLDSGRRSGSPAGRFPHRHDQNPARPTVS